MLDTAARIGNQRPRLESHPPYASSLGRDAIELAAYAGLTLDPWQQYVLETSMGQRPGGKWAAFEVGLVVPRQNGKGAIIEARQLAALFLSKDPLIIYSAHQFKTAKMMFRRIKALCQQTPELDRMVASYRNSNEETGIELKSGHRLQFFARSDGSGRGFSGDTMFFDEAYDLSPDLLADMLPTLSAMPNPQIWYVSSAGKPSSAALSAIRARGIAGEGRLAYFEWSGPEGSDLDDIDGLYDCNPALGIRLDLDYVLSVERPGMASDELYGRERWGIWPGTGPATVISPGSWNNIANPLSRRHGDALVLAVAAEEDRSRAVISVACANQFGRVHIEVIDARDGVSWVPARLKELADRRRPRAIVLDSSGAAGSILPDLQRLRIPLMLAPPEAMKKACGAFYDAIRDETINHTGIQTGFTGSVLAGTRHRTSGAWIWGRGPGSAPLISATLALYGWTTKKPTTSTSSRGRRAVVLS